MSRQDPSDAELISSSLTEPQAFHALFERHFPVVYRYVLRRAGRMAADDLAAETFTQAFIARDRYDRSRPDARPWLLGIATHLLSRHRRAEANQLNAYARQARQEGGERDEVHLELEARVDLARAIPYMARALRTLRPEDRDVLLLVGWADLTYRETAAALGLPIGTVRSRLSRARQELRTILEPIP